MGVVIKYSSTNSGVENVIYSLLSLRLYVYSTLRCECMNSIYTVLELTVVICRSKWISYASYITFIFIKYLCLSNSQEFNTIRMMANFYLFFCVCAMHNAHSWTHIWSGRVCDLQTIMFMSMSMYALTEHRILNLP